MSKFHPHPEHHQAFVEGVVTSFFFEKYVEYMATSEAGLTDTLTTLAGSLTTTERKLLRDTSRPASRDALTDRVKKMSLKDRVALANIVLGGSERGGVNRPKSSTPTADPDRR